MNLHAIAGEMKAAQDLGRQIEPLTARVRGFDNAAAYEVASLIHEARIREGALPVARMDGPKMAGVPRPGLAPHVGPNDLVVLC